MVMRHSLRIVLSHAALQFDTLERLAKKRRLEDAEMAVMQVPAPMLCRIPVHACYDAPRAGRGVYEWWFVQKPVASSSRLQEQLAHKLTALLPLPTPLH